MVKATWDKKLHVHASCARPYQLGKKPTLKCLPTKHGFYIVPLSGPSWGSQYAKDWLQTLQKKNFPSGHNRGKKAYPFKRINTRGKTMKETTIYPRTQKAKGIAHLANWHNSCSPFLYSLPYLAGAVDKREDLWVWPHSTPDIEHTGPLFARPCPVWPCHGFVDSLHVRNLSEVVTICAETQTADPEGEVVFMPHYDGAFSALIHNAGIVVGRGPNSCTSGTGCAPYIPTGSKNWNDVAAGPDNAVNLGIHDTAYAELVSDDETMRVVQLRDGPAIGLAIDYIPAPVTVKHVFTNQGENGALIDLMKWPKLLKKIAKEWPDGGAVFDHSGGSLGSHYAVHARNAGFPIVCSHTPHLLEKLVVPSEQTSVTAYAELADLTALWLTYHLNDWRSANHPAIVAAAFAAFHAHVHWGNEPHLLMLLAHSLAYTARYVFAGCLGEMRHYRDQGPGGGRKPATDFHDLLTPFEAQLLIDGYGCPRNVIYRPGLNSRPDALVRQAGNMYDDLSSGWERRNNYGGLSWGEGALAAGRLVHSLGLFMLEPGRATYKAVIDAWNLTINASHNNGAILSKWLNSTALDTLAFNHPGLGFASFYAARLITCRDGDSRDTYHCHGVGYNVRRRVGEAIKLAAEEGELARWEGK